MLNKIQCFLNYKINVVKKFKVSCSKKKKKKDSQPIFNYPSKLTTKKLQFIFLY